MKFKRISLLTLLSGMIFSIIGVIVPFFVLRSYTSPNVGIIGGAGAPTYKFVVFHLMNGLPFVAILFGITLIVSALFCLIFSETVKTNCNIKTTALSLGLSAVCGLGLFCAFLWLTIVSFDEMFKYPIAYPFSMILGLLCVILFIVLLALYIKLRKNTWSIKGLFIDVLTCVVYLPTFFFAFSCFYEILS